MDSEIQNPMNDNPSPSLMHHICFCSYCCICVRFWRPMQPRLFRLVTAGRIRRLESLDYYAALFTTLRDPMFSHFSSTPTYDGQTDT